MRWGITVPLQPMQCLLKPLEDNVTAVGIPARPIKKDGVTIPKEKKSLTLEEYEDNETADGTDGEGD